MKTETSRSLKGPLFSLACAMLAAAGLTACGSEKTDPKKESPPPTNQPIAANPGGAGNFAPAGKGSPATTFSMPGQATPPATTGPNGRSTVPTIDEWTAAKEIGVKGSSKLNCETKMVREWLRVSCKGKNDTGGEPKSVTIKRGGGRGDTFTFAGNKVASLVCPFVVGTDIAADFEWTDKKKELVVSWPYGAPEPPLKGEFR